METMLLLASEWKKAGFLCVALMGSSLSKQQEDRSVVILLDGDEAGRAKRTAVRIVASPDGKQPDQFSVEQIEELLARTF